MGWCGGLRRLGAEAPNLGPHSAAWGLGVLPTQGAKEGTGRGLCCGLGGWKHQGTQGLMGCRHNPHWP